MSYIQFRLAARTDAAGKYNESAPLEGNEDNMFVDSDLSNQVQGQFMADKVVDLSEKGCLMVVADGMGGMNAGEVASDIAIKTVMGFFAPERMSQKSFNNTQARINYLEEVVVAADAAIKADAQNNKEHEGMGSTLIMAWLCDGQVCITWCGDSRAYLFRPAVGFRQVSKDHSYVQGLVDEGKITEAEAFDHPYGNIITRSLGDPEKKAKPDSISFNVYQGDIIMLCSDGLSGVLRDRKTIINGERVDTENLEDLIRSNRATMAGCRDELFAAAERNDWYDNVTAILCEIVKGDPLPVSQAKPMPQASAAEPQVTYAPMPDPSAALGKKRSKALIPVIAIAAVLLLCVAGLLVWMFAIPKGPKADAKFFAECQKKNDVNLYRSYVNLYPKGDSVAVAKAWIKNWVQDSINEAKGLTLDESEEIADNSSTSNDKKADKNADKDKKKDLKEKEKKEKAEEEAARLDEERRKAEEEEQRKAEEEEQRKAEKRRKAEGSLRIDDGNGSGDGSNNDVPDSHLRNKSTSLTLDGKVPDGKTITGISLDDDTGGNKNDTQTTETPKKKSGEMTEEEKAYSKIEPKINNNAVELGDCEKYLKVYYKDHPQGNKSHWKKVADKFKSLYTSKINRSDIKQLESIINNHDKYIASLNLNGMPEYDKKMKELAIAKKKQLEKEEPKSGGDGIIKEGEERPQPKKVEIKNRIK